MTVYRSDLPAVRWFVGRARERDEAVHAAHTGRHALRAFMGGRGMGKSSLLEAIARGLAGAPGLAVVRVDQPTGEPATLLQMVLRALGAAAEEVTTSGLRDVLARPEAPRLVLLIDEVEALLDTRPGRELLEGLRTLYERVPDKLAVFVFGGARLRMLLRTGTSPFLRTAKLIALRAFDLAETAELLRAPLALAVDDEIVELVWEHTNGHPLLLQRVMERATGEGARGDTIDERVQAALGDLEDDDVLLSLWWENLTAEGQRVFRELVRQPSGVPDDDAPRLLGDRPFEWIEVMESTGVARRAGGLTAPRGELFRRWFARNFAPLPGRPGVGLTALPWEALGVNGLFEQQVVSAVARWVRDTLEFPSYALRTRPGKKANDLLQEEDYYQISLLQCLRQHGWIVEPDPFSVERKARVDLKVRAGDERACGEVKRWAGTPEDYKGLVAQVLKYGMPTDAFAFTVMVDRKARPLAPEYRSECIPPEATVRWPEEDAPEEVRIPAFVTTHARPAAPAIRVYHFLLQLPPDGDAAA